MDKESVEILEKTGFKFLMAESIKGVNEDALLCLKKPGTGTDGKPASWEAAEDYEAFVRDLAGRERERLRKLSAQGLGEGEAEKLKIDTFFAESDFMIGKKGEEFFRACWNRAEFRDAFEFEGMMVEKSNHDSVMECWRGGFEKMCREARWSLLGN